MAVGGPETDVASLPGTAPAIDLPRAVRLLTGLAWFSWAQLWLQGSGQSAIAPVISTFALLGGVVIIGISIASWPAERWRKVDVLILTGTLVIVGLWLGVNASAHLLLVHASSIRRDEGVGVHGHPRVRLAGRGLAVAGGVVAAAASATFLLSPAPLQLSIAGTHRAVDTAGNITVSLDVVAVNLTDQPIHPAFAVTSKGYLNPGWRPSAGSGVLPPHARETYRLVPTDPRTTIDKNAVFRVDALATDPSSISTSEWATAP